jgi:hypothetical protein
MHVNLLYSCASTVRMSLLQDCCDCVMGAPTFMLWAAVENWLVTVGTRDTGSRGGVILFCTCLKLTCRSRQSVEMTGRGVPKRPPRTISP